MAARYQIVAISTNQGVMATFSNERVITIAPAKDITAFASLDNVVPDITINVIAATGASEEVIAGTPAKIIGTANTEHGNRMWANDFNTILITRPCENETLGILRYRDVTIIEP